MKGSRLECSHAEDTFRYNPLLHVCSLFNTTMYIHWQPLQYLETRYYKIRTYLSSIYTIYTVKLNARNI